MANLDVSQFSSNSQLNNSASKMKYSFPKSNRFDNKRYENSSPSKFYDLPEIKSKRSAGIGYGSKMDLGKQHTKTPAPDTYNLSSSFNLKANQGITIGEGRDKIKANDMFKINFKVPGPQQYSPESARKKSLSYSMSSRLPDHTDKWIASVPGPGNYSTFETMNKQTKIAVSKYLSAPSTRFGNLKRLSEAELSHNKNPGPGEYNNETLISKRFDFKNGSKFPVTNRPSMSNPNKTPGPGTYNRASDFN